MKKFKRALSLIMVFAMVLSSTTIALADTTYVYTEAYNDYLKGWTQNDAFTPDNVDTFTCVTNAKAHSGEHSLLLRHADTSKNWSNLSVRQSVATEAGNYKFGLWVTGDYENIQFNQIAITGNTAIKLNYQTPIAATEGDWKYYEYDVVVPEGQGTTEIIFYTNGNTNGLYIDDVTLIKENTTANVLVNGSFDDNGKPKYTEDYEDCLKGWTQKNAFTPDNVDTFTCVTNAKAHSGEHSLLLRHADSTNNWKALTVGQTISIGEGTYTLTFWATGDYDKNQFNSVIISGDEWIDTKITDAIKTDITDGEWTKYAATITVPAAKTETLFRVITNGSTEALYIDDISLVKEGSTNNVLVNGSFDDNGKPNYTNAYADYLLNWRSQDAFEQDGIDNFTCVTDAKAHSGEHSLLLRHTNLDKNWSALGFGQDILIGEGEYTLSFWAAGEYDKTQFNAVIISGDEWIDTKITDAIKTNITDGEWTKYVTTITVPAGKKETFFKVVTNGNKTEALYIDDISLVKNGSTVNLIANSSFDFNGVVDYTTENQGYLTNWTVDNAAAVDGENVYTCITDTMAHSGTNSLVLRHVDSAQNWSATAIKQNISIGAGTYTINFWAAGKYTQSNFVGAYINGDEFIALEFDDFTIVEREGDWVKYTATFVVSSGTETTFKFASNGNTEYLLIDDIELCTPTGKNVLQNASFDKETSADEFVNPIIYATSEGNAVNVSWTNPSVSYDEIKIYFDNELQEETGVDVSANAFNEFYYSGVANYIEHTIKIEAIRDGEVVYVFEDFVWTDDLGEILDYVGNQKLEGWKFARKDTSTNYANSIPSIDYSDKASGNSSLKIVGNIPTWTDNLYPNIQQQVTLYRNKLYALSFDVKMDNVGILSVIEDIDDIADMGEIWSRNVLVNNFTTSDWTTMTIPLVYEDDNGNSTYDVMAGEDETYTANVLICVEQILGSINIDNVKLYEIEEDDASYTPINKDENLLVNGGFEFGSYEVADAKFELVDGSDVTEIDEITSGKIKVTSSIRNASMGDDFNTTTIIAVYNNNILLNVPYIFERKVEQSAVYLPSDSFSATVTIPEMIESDKYEIKVFYWNGLNTMKSLKALDSLK